MTTSGKPDSPPPYQPPAPVTTSDLKLHSPTAVTTVSSPQSVSPVPSPSISHTGLSTGFDINIGSVLPASLERTISIRKGTDQLGEAELEYSKKDTQINIFFCDTTKSFLTYNIVI